MLNTITKYFQIIFMAQVVGLATKMTPSNIQRTMYQLIIHSMLYHPAERGLLSYLSMIPCGILIASKYILNIDNESLIRIVS